MRVEFVALSTQTTVNLPLETPQVAFYYWPRRCPY